MRIATHKNFRRGLEKLASNQKIRVGETMRLFLQNPHDPLLGNHPLHGKYKGERAISAGGDLRLVFIEENNYERVLFLRVGSHNQVY